MVDWASVHSPAQCLAIAGLAEAAARDRPDIPALQLTLADALSASGKHGEALLRLEEACGRFPEADVIHAGYGRALLLAGRLEEALARAKQWSHLPWARQLAFKAALRMNDLECLSRLEADLAEADPFNPDLLEFRAWAWRSRPEELLAACNDALLHDSGAVHAVYHKILALLQLGRADEASELMSLDAYLRVERLDIPETGAASEAFRAELRREIESNATLHPDPAGHASYHGLRTAAFPAPADLVGPVLLCEIRSRIEAYSSSIRGEHPFAAARPLQARFTSWALLFEGDGSQRLHHHPGPWMTGVYYVAAPATTGKAGALRIGGVPDWLGATPPWPVRDIAPEPGTLVLFPSYVPHETIPTGSRERRISIAFDVMDVRR